jgi:hypothetical protein
VRFSEKYQELQKKQNEETNKTKQDTEASMHLLNPLPPKPIQEEGTSLKLPALPIQHFQVNFFVLIQLIWAFIILFTSFLVNSHDWLWNIISGLGVIAIAFFFRPIDLTTIEHAYGNFQIAAKGWWMHFSWIRWIHAHLRLWIGVSSIVLVLQAIFPWMPLLAVGVPLFVVGVSIYLMTKPLEDWQTLFLILSGLMGIRYELSLFFSSASVVDALVSAVFFYFAVQLNLFRQSGGELSANPTE